MSEQEEEAKVPEEKFPTVQFKDFLESSPPYHIVTIQDFWNINRGTIEIQKPNLTLLCEEDSCQGMRFFKHFDSTGGLYNKDEPNVVFLQYVCKNCGHTVKSFSLIVFERHLNGIAIAVKVGEWPPFGPKTPPRLLKLLGPDKDLFLRGRRAENYGLGIGAFTYYRRVVENQKNRLLDEIIRVVQKVESSPAEIIADLTKAKDTFQFTQVMKDVKLAIPQLLLVDGHNPLLLLHATLSAGIHDKSDDECLELAQSIRFVLAGLVERIDQALSEKKELTDAVCKLLQVNAAKGKKNS